MTQTEINSINDRVVEHVAGGRVRDALALLRNTTESQMLWEITDEINRIEQSYAYMLQYLTDGSADPGRDDMYAAIVSGIYGILDRLTRRLRLVEARLVVDAAVDKVELPRRGGPLRIDAVVLARCGQGPALVETFGETDFGPHGVGSMRTLISSVNLLTTACGFSNPTTSRGSFFTPKIRCPPSVLANADTDFNQLRGFFSSRRSL